MKKKIIIGLSILIIAVLAGGFWFVRNIIMKKEELSREKQVTQEDQKKFIVDVDMNVDNWQTKETEFFTIKFPREWYWLESSHSEREGYSRVITNNLDFDINKHEDIGIFSDIGLNPPIMLSNSTEIVISERGKPTSNAGSPMESLNSTLGLAKKNNSSVLCSVIEDKVLPLKAYCSVVFNDSGMRQQSYYIINNEIALTFAAWTTQENSKNLIDILEKIARSYSYE